MKNNKLNTLSAIMLVMITLVTISCNKDDDNGNGSQTYTLGDTGPAGGIVFYVDGNGGGLEAAPAGWNGEGNNDAVANWGCAGTEVEGTHDAVGTGMANTQAIINTCTTPGIAAKICNELEFNGFSDWFLPSKDELIILYNNRELLDEYRDSWYWSSTQSSASGAWARHFGVEGMPIEGRNKGTATNVRVRPVRAIN